ncbi:MAG: hypothetical protein KFF73_03840, partial [Cyclobacteriaceae bacterium]|nr:hypothetical protein [Cyclobacteriaceae bacterium]
MRISSEQYLILILASLISHLCLAQSVKEISIGSKKFPESRLLAEIVAQLLEKSEGYKVNRRFGLGGTMICFEALRQGEIDLYPEYTGTGLTAILNRNIEGKDA